MTDSTATSTPQAPAAAEPATSATTAPAAAAPATSTSPTPGDPANEFKSEESKAAVLADLASVREAFKGLKAETEARDKAIAAAFGLTEVPKGEDLAETVKNLQAQIAQDRHAALLDRVAAANGIDDEHKDLLTETDPEKLKAQAAKVGALVALKNGATAPPAFQANPGQGQGGAPATPEAQAEAEYNAFYPTPNRK